MRQKSVPDNSDSEKNREQLSKLLHSSELLSSEAQGISVVSQWAEYFEKRYNTKISDVLKMADDWKHYITVPVTAFSKYIGGLEATVLFLRHGHRLTFSEIARVLGRNPRTIWSAYHKAKEKIPFVAEPRPTKIHIPVTQLANRKFTILEIICAVLKNHYGLRNHKIATLLGRSDSFVWITLKRYEEKNEN